MIDIGVVIHNESKESAALKLRTLYMEMEQQVLYYQQLCLQYKSEIGQLKAQCVALQKHIKEMADKEIRNI